MHAKHGGKELEPAVRNTMEWCSKLCSSWDDWREDLVKHIEDGGDRNNFFSRK